MNPCNLGRILYVPALSAVALCLGATSASAQNAYRVNNLVSDIPGMAFQTDPNLVNPWGISEGPTTPFWVANNGTGTSTLYTGAGTPLSLVVTIPGAGGMQAAPTGTVFLNSSGFNNDRFFFASEDGVISGWRGPLGTHAEVLQDFSSMGAEFKGLAAGTLNGHNYLYATDFANNTIRVLDGTGAAPAITGTFTDSMGLPSGYSPFNIQNIGGSLYVTYALRDPMTGDDVAGLGNGFIDVYNLNGDFQRRLVSGGALDSPWGLAWAPAGFGDLAGDLLVGNFGNGWINAFDPTTGDWVDALRDGAGNPIGIDGLWGLSFGNGTANGGAADTLYFTAGIPGNGNVEDHGLFGSFSAVPEPSTVYAGIFTVGACGLMFLRRRRAAKAV